MLQKNTSPKLINSVQKAAELLRSGELVAIPTETVYGLAANAWNEKAIRSIYETKGRPSNNPLIIHIKSQDSLNEIAREIPEIAQRLAAKFWPGPLTLILKKQPTISDTISANYDTVAVRVPNHPLTLELLNAVDFPLVAPSANRSNHISPTKPEHVMKSLGQNSPYILEGGSCEHGLESTIIGFNGDDVILYRQGAIPQEVLESFIGIKIIDFAKQKSQINSPGTSEKHYSPKTKLILTKNIDEFPFNDSSKIGYLTFQRQMSVSGKNVSITLSETGDLEEAATNLYHALHQLDELNLDLIVAEKMPDYGLGNSINDRLMRAAAI